MPNHYAKFGHDPLLSVLTPPKQPEDLANSDPITITLSIGTVRAMFELAQLGWINLGAIVHEDGPDAEHWVHELRTRSKAIIIACDVNVFGRVMSTMVDIGAQFGVRETPTGGSVQDHLRAILQEDTDL